MKKQTILTGHTTLTSAYQTKESLDNPKRYYWIQSRDGIGDRLGSCTVDKAGNFGPVEYGLDCSYSFLFLDRVGDLKQGIYHFSGHPSVNRQRFIDLLTEIEPYEISPEQQQFIRLEIYRSFLDYSISERPPLPENAEKKFQEWAVRTAQHIAECPFERIAGYIPWEARQSDYLPATRVAA